MRALILLALFPALTALAARPDALQQAQFRQAEVYFKDSDVGDTFDQVKPGIDGVRTIQVEVVSQRVAWPPEGLARAGFKTQQQADIHYLACHADLVVVATASATVSAMHSSRRSIITRVSFDHPQLLYSAPGASAQTPLAVMIHSGAVTVNGQRYQYLNNVFPGYFVGRQYLLWLKRDPVEATVFYPHSVDYSPGPSVLGSIYEAPPRSAPALKAALDEIMALSPCRD